MHACMGSVLYIEHTNTQQYCSFIIFKVQVEVEEEKCRALLCAAFICNKPACANIYVGTQHTHEHENRKRERKLKRKCNNNNNNILLYN